MTTTPRFATRSGKIIVVRIPEKPTPPNPNTRKAHDGQMEVYDYEYEQYERALSTALKEGIEVEESQQDWAKDLLPSSAWELEVGPEDNDEILKNGMIFHDIPVPTYKEVRQSATAWASKGMERWEDCSKEENQPSLRQYRTVARFEEGEKPYKEEKSVWFLEHVNTGGWLADSVHLNWTKDPQKAKRFTTSQQAQEYDDHNSKNGNELHCYPTEHIFVMKEANGMLWEGEEPKEEPKREIKYGEKSIYPDPQKTLEDVIKLQKRQFEIEAWKKEHPGVFVEGGKYEANGLMWDIPKQSPESRPVEDKPLIIVDPLEKLKYPLLREESIQNGHDCWGKLEWTSEYYVYIGKVRERVFEGNFIAHDGNEVKEVLYDWQLKDKIEYQEKNPSFNYGWTPSTEKDYKNQKEGMEYRMILKQPKKPEPIKNPVEDAIKTLLAVLHGDGGHYTQNNGLLKSIQDAEKLLHKKWSVTPPSTVRDSTIKTQDGVSFCENCNQLTQWNDNECQRCKPDGYGFGAKGLLTKEEARTGRINLGSNVEPAEVGEQESLITLLGDTLANFEQYGTLSDSIVERIKKAIG